MIQTKACLTPPVIVPVNTRRAVWIALGSALCALASFGIWLLMVWSAPQNSPVVPAFLGFGFFAILAAYFIGIAIAAPVALRIDHQGISGYYADPATWQDIKRIGLWHTKQDMAHLGFELHDPKQFFDEQSAWRRLLTWSNGRNVGFHITVPSTILTGHDAGALAELARSLHHQATNAE